ncbi:MAG: hypothetical protein PHY99_07135 [Bacteroidales bacterium]|nr:hypothetical protein [Bacteroidales bacterium]
MKNFGLYILALLTVLTSCSNDLDLIDPINPIPVVYCQLNPDDSVFYLTLTHSFSGDSSAFDMAREPNRIFYDSADIRLEAWTDQYKVMETRFTPSDKTKSPGIFPQVAGYCYQAPNVFLNFSQTITSYRLIMNIPGVADPVFARISDISAFLLSAENENKIMLYPDNFKIDMHAKHGFIVHGIKRFELVCTFRYQELEGSWVDHSVTFSMGKNIQFGSDGNDFIYPDLFFNKLGANIKPVNDTIVRRFISLDLILLGADKYLVDYIDTYVNTGNLDLPPLGNINNGYGLFTMMRKSKLENMDLDLQTYDSLAQGKITKKLGFVKWH